MAEETVVHANRDCMYAAEACQFSFVNAMWMRDQDTKIINWFSKLLPRLDKKSFEKGLVTLWSIWNSRNAELKNNEKGAA